MDPRPWLLVSLAALACACYPARAGYWPPTERLPELRPGQSSQADVEALLGPPLGRGGARFTPEMSRREVWVYGYLDYAGGTRADQAQLMVFFDDGRYDGHFWTLSGRPPVRSQGDGP